MTEKLTDDESSFIVEFSLVALRCNIVPVDVIRMVGRISQGMALLHAFKNGISAAESFAVFGAAFDDGLALGTPMSKMIFDANLVNPPASSC